MSTDWSWKQAVADRVLQLVNERSSAEFTIDDVYNYVDEFSTRFPRNRHVKEKLRQTLQRLRDDKLLLFHGGGHYELNLGFEELQSEVPPMLQPGVEVPATRQVLRHIRLRCTLLSLEIKRRYNNYLSSMSYRGRPLN
jgi:hypothetical protein